MFAFVPNTCYAALVWADDFNDGNLEGWEQNGACTADELWLRWNRSISVGIAYRDSTIVVGTWKFDLIELAGAGTSKVTRVRFIHTNGFSPWMYYYVELTRDYTNGGTYPVYSLGKGVSGQRTALDSYDGLEGELTTHHFWVTRTSAGEMNVYVNGTLVMQAVNNEVDFSTYFHFATDRDTAIDNIEIDDEVLLPEVTPTTTGTPTDTSEPPPAIPMELVVVILGGAAVVVVVIAVILKRRG
jgi:hypothetical protein